MLFKNTKIVILVLVLTSVKCITLKINLCARIKTNKYQILEHSEDQ